MKTAEQRRQLEYLEKRLLQAREHALREISLFDERARSSGPDASGDLSRFPLHAADEGSDAMEREVAFAIASGTSDLYSQIEEALSLLYEAPDRYGTCRNCSRVIPFARLELIPWTQLCEACESAAEAAAPVTGGESAREAGTRASIGAALPAAQLTLRSIMSTDVVSLQPDATIREAATLLADKGIGGAPVVGDDRILGVISARDILEFNAATPGVPVESEDGMPWGEWPVPEDGEEGGEPASVYFLDLWLDSGADLAKGSAFAGPEWDVLSEHTIDEIMTRQLFTLSPDTSLADAARYMLRAGIHRALLVEEQRLVGVVTTMDFLRAIAERRT